MKKTADSGTRWRLITYSYENDFPSTVDDEADRTFLETGITGVSISRSKSDPNSPCIVTFNGDIPSEIFIGNWCIVQSKVGPFKRPDVQDGMVRFIGQIADVQTVYQKDETGNLRRQSRAVIRSWGTVLQCPVRYDLASVSYAIPLSPTDIISYVGQKVDGGEGMNNMVALAESVFNCWSYVGIVLQYIGAMNESVKGNLIAEAAAPSATFASAEQFPDVATKMPSIPQQLLYDIGAYDAEPANPFKTGDGFAGIYLGVHQLFDNYDKEKEAGIPRAFSGIFKDDPKALYKPTKDRPLITNIGSEFTRGESAWNLITTRADNAMNEVFTDIWYIEGDNGPIARPVLVFRDKPYALETLWNRIHTGSAFKSEHTKFDNLPRVWIDDALIMSVNLRSTFYGSPNMVNMRFKDGAIAEGYPRELALKMSRIRLAKEMARFGGIEHYADTSFGVVDTVTMGDKTVGVDVNWYRDTAQMNYLWYCLGYRFLSGNMTLKDNNTPVMVGNNITWKMGKNTLCAQVDSIQWNHTVTASGMKSTNCQIGFSYCCHVLDDGSLELLGPSAFNNIFEEIASDKFSLPTSGEQDISSLLDQVEVFKKAKELVNSAREKFNQGLSMFKSGTGFMG